MKMLQVMVAAGAAVIIAAPVQADTQVSSALLKQGRYIAKLGGCNDCHTAGYLMSEGKIPEEQWLLGDQFGWRGPWGTTYATNLRLLVADMTEQQWMAMARVLKTRPPMPWWKMHEMKEEDLKSLYHYIRHLGAAGEPAPAYVPPDQEPPPPYASFPAPPQ